MAAPFSNDLRKRIIEAKERGQSVKEIEENFSVKKSMIYNLLNLFKETGKYEPRTRNAGRKPKLNEEQLEQIKELIIKESDIQLDDIKDKLNLPICISALCRIINNKLKLVRKKNSSCKRTQQRGCEN